MGDIASFIIRDKSFGMDLPFDQMVKMAKDGQYEPLGKAFAQILIGIDQRLDNPSSGIILPPHR